MTNTPIRIEQIRRAHKSARPKAENPAWRNAHHDLGVALDYIDELQRANDGYRAMLNAALSITQAVIAELPAPFVHRVSWTQPDGESTWTQYHDADDPLPTDWEGEPPDEIIALYTENQLREEAAAICMEAAAEFGGVAEGPIATEFGKAIHEAMAAGALHCAVLLRNPILNLEGT